MHVSRPGLVVGEADVRFVRIVAFPKGVSSRNAVSLACGEVTTRKKMTSVTKGPSAVSFRYMPGFSRTSQLRSDWNGGRAMFFSPWWMNGLAASTAAPDIEFLVARRSVRRRTNRRGQVRQPISRWWDHDMHEMSAIALHRRRQPTHAMHAAGGNAARQRTISNVRRISDVCSAASLILAR